MGLVNNYGRGGLQNVRGQVKFQPFEKRGGGEEGGGVAETVLAMLKGGGGHNNFVGSFYGVALSFSHIEWLGGGAQNVSTL